MKGRKEKKKKGESWLKCRHFGLKKTNKQTTREILLKKKFVKTRNTHHHHQKSSGCLHSLNNIIEEMTKEEEEVEESLQVMGADGSGDKELLELDLSSIVLRFPDIPTTQPIVNKGHYSIGRSDDGSTSIRRLRRRSLDASFYGNLNKPTMVSDTSEDSHDEQTSLTTPSFNGTNVAHTEEVTEAFEAPEDKPAPIITPLIIDATVNANNSSLSNASKPLPPFEFDLLTR